jgi:putative ABC transport system substrate-binding protein
MRRRDLFALLGGAAVAAPAAAHAQPKAIPVIGFLGAGSAGPNAPFMAALRQGLSEAGYDEGRTLAIEYHWAEGHYERLPALAAELIDRKVDLVVSQGGSGPALAAKKATSTIPIVFITGGDPVADGLVTSLARPIGNITGVTWLSSELGPKRLELLRELVPQARAFALLVNPGFVGAEPLVQTMQQAARASGVRLHALSASSEAEIDAAFAAIDQDHDGGLVVAVDPYLGNRREQIAALAARHAVPTIFGYREFATAGGLMSYGPSLSAAFRQAGIYAGKILKGAKPADLPVPQPTTFELVINLKVAKALGLTVPSSILARADEVIE